MELAYVGNVAPRFVTDRANEVAAILGGTAEAKDKATMFDFGAKYFLKPVFGGYDPYVGLSAGIAHVSKETTFSIGGSTLNESQLLEQYGVQLGNDSRVRRRKEPSACSSASRATSTSAMRSMCPTAIRAFSPRRRRLRATGINVNRLQAGIIVRF